MDRRAACLAQADACRAKAQADLANSDHWIEESIKWLERATDPTGGLSITFETKDEQQLTADGAVPRSCSQERDMDMGGGPAVRRP
jgi:hypothetical protein